MLDYIWGEIAFIVIGLWMAACFFMMGVIIGGMAKGKHGKHCGHCAGSDDNVGGSGGLVGDDKG